MVLSEFKALLALEPGEMPTPGVICPCAMVPSSTDIATGFESVLQINHFRLGSHLALFWVLIFELQPIYCRHSSVNTFQEVW